MRIFNYVAVVGVVLGGASTAYADGWSSYSVSSSSAGYSSWSVSSAAADASNLAESRASTLGGSDGSTMGAWQLSDGEVAEGASVMLAATDGDYGASAMMVEATPAETQVSGFDSTGAVPMLAYVNADPY